MTRRVLIVDDDPTIRASLGDALSADGIKVSVAENGAMALGLVEHAAPDVVLSDIRMDDVDGLTLLRTLRERAPEIDIVLMTAFDDMPTVVAAMRDGAVEFLVKPLDLRRAPQPMLDRVLRGPCVAAPARCAQRLSTPRARQRLVGRDPRMIAIYKLIGQAAGTRATVLIRGESGTGKELVARAIHADCGLRPTNRSSPVNCAALPSTLLESELFGHVRGAFTGAVAAHRQAASRWRGHGTIFLDEIGDTSLEFQSKLLRVLQDREFQPVGAERDGAHRRARDRRDAPGSRATRCRAAIPRGPLLSPARRGDRRSRRFASGAADIPLLAEQMVRRASAALGAAMPVMLGGSPRQARCSIAWPGNVRELENCVMRAVVVAAGERGAAGTPVHRVPAAAPHHHPSPLDRTWNASTSHACSKSTGGHKARAAELLGVSRPRLNRLIEKYGLK